MKHILVIFFLCLLAAVAEADTKLTITSTQAEAVTQWLVDLAVKAAPPGRAWKPPAGPHADETPEQRLARYEDIARDIVAVVFHEDVEPIAGMSRLQSAGFTLAMALGESGLSPDADLGPCYRGGAYRTRCDGGLAVGILQVQLPVALQAEYFHNRRKLIHKAVRGLSGSIGACAALPVRERLAAYGAGSCSSKRGREVSRQRWRYIERVLSQVAPPKLQQPRAPGT